MDGGGSAGRGVDAAILLGQQALMRFQGERRDRHGYLGERLESLQFPSRRYPLGLQRWEEKRWSLLEALEVQSHKSGKIHEDMCRRGGPGMKECTAHSSGIILRETRNDAILEMRTIISKGVSITNRAAI